MSKNYKNKHYEEIMQIEEAKKELGSELMTEKLKIVIQLRKASYEAHIAAGFSEEQALKLCVN